MIIIMNAVINKWCSCEMPGLENEALIFMLYHAISKHLMILPMSYEQTAYLPQTD